MKDLFCVIGDKNTYPYPVKRKWYDDEETDK